MKFEELKATLIFDTRVCLFRPGGPTSRPSISFHELSHMRRVICDGIYDFRHRGNPIETIRVDFEHEALTFTQSEGFLRSERAPVGLSAVQQERLEVGFAHGAPALFGDLQRTKGRRRETAHERHET
jgi:hypothetical protein